MFSFSFARNLVARVSCRELYILHLFKATILDYTDEAEGTQLEPPTPADPTAICADAMDSHRIDSDRQVHSSVEQPRAMRTAISSLSRHWMMSQSTDREILESNPLPVMPEKTRESRNGAWGWNGVTRVLSRMRMCTNICVVGMDQREPYPTWWTCPGVSGPPHIYPRFGLHMMGTGQSRRIETI